MTLRIGEIAERSGVTPRTIRYYEELGLLPRTEREHGKHRIYTEADVERLQELTRLRDLLDRALPHIDTQLGLVRRKLDEHEQRQQHDRGRQTADHERAAPAGQPALRECEHEPREADDVRRRTEQVESALRVLLRELVQDERGPDAAGEPERHVEPEDPRP